MQGKKNYIQKYNETHYRQINMRVSEEIAIKFDELKPQYGSAPKLLSAGLVALENKNNCEIELEKLREENQKLKNRNEFLEKNNTSNYHRYSDSDYEDLEMMNKRLKKRLSEFEDKSIFSFIFYRLQTWWEDKFD